MPDVLYVPVDVFKDTTSIPDGLGEADAERALAAASRAVEELCQRRTFALDATETTRRYTATGTTVVAIDDVATITSVVSDGATLVADTDYVVEPLNAAADDRPYTMLLSEGGYFAAGAGKVQVTGRFGWPQVPPQVEQFVTTIAAKLLKRAREAPFGVVQSGLDGVAVRLAKTDPDAMLLIDPLIRHTPVVL